MNISFQPIVDIDSEAVVRAEALCRVDAATTGVEGTAAYIQRAEQSGLMRGLTEAILELALREYDVWEAGPGLSVNLSRANLDEPDFADRIKRLLDEHGIEGPGLTLELSEGIEMLDDGPPLEILRALAAARIRVSVDGFGPTLSMFSHIELERIGARELKVDAKYLSSLGGSRRAVLRGMVDLCRASKIDAVIKNVETAQEMGLARDVGCNFAQGHLIAMPMEPSAFRSWLGGRNVVPAARKPAVERAAAPAPPERRTFFQKLFRPGT